MGEVVAQLRQAALQADGVGLRVEEAGHGRVEPHEGTLAAVAGGLDAVRLLGAASVLDHALQELHRGAGELVVRKRVEDVGHAGGVRHGLALEADHVGRGAAGVVVVAKDALHAGDGALVGLLRELDDGGPGLGRAPADGGELVDAAQGRLRVAGGQLGAHAKGVDGRALRKERLDGVLVQVV